MDAKAPTVNLADPLTRHDDCLFWVVRGEEIEMTVALSATALLAAVLFYYSMLPFGAVLAAVILMFALRPGRRSWPVQ